MPELSEGLMVTPSLRLERLIGEGAMGSVWVADHLTLSTKVAVKFIARDHRMKSREAVLTRFEREARAAAQIKSPHVVHMYDHGVMESGTPYIVMELLEGESLGARLRRDRSMPVDEVVEVVRQCCKALTKAHELGIVHRDIKPDNIFLLPAEDEIFVKVLDFGIAKTTTDPHEAVTTTGAMLGTPLYMSPEVVKSARQADHRADLWAVAVVAYEALVGKPPWRGETVGALFFSICGDPVEPPSSRRKGLPRAFDGWFSRALCQDAARRFATARELGDTFAAAAEGATAEGAGEPESARQGAADTALLGTAEFISREELHADVDAATVERGRETAAVDSSRTRERTGAETASVATPSGSVAGSSEPPTGQRATKRAAGVDAPSDSAPASGRQTSDEASAAPANATLNGAATHLRPKSGRARWAAVAAVAAGLVGAGYLVLGDDGLQTRVAIDTETTAAASEPLVPLRIRCDEGCDLVSVDGRDYRRDELVAAAEQHGETPAEGELRIMIAPGRHRLRVERDGYVAVAEDIDVLDGVPFEKRFHLEPKKGRLPQEVLARILERNKTKYWACYDTALERAPKLRGRVEVSFVIDPRGNVDEVTVDGIGDEALHSCLRQSFKSIGFPAPEGGGRVEVRYPLDLQPSAPTAPASTGTRKKAPITTASTDNTPSRKKSKKSSYDKPIPQQQSDVPAPNSDEPVQQKNEPVQQKAVIQAPSNTVYDEPPPPKEAK